MSVMLVAVLAIEILKSHFGVTFLMLVSSGLSILVDPAFLLISIRLYSRVLPPKALLLLAILLLIL